MLQKFSIFVVQVGIDIFKLQILGLFKKTQFLPNITYSFLFEFYRLNILRFLKVLKA